MSHILDVLVIGAGQAGLALAWALRGTQLRVALVDRAERVGDSWRRRYDSLTLFSPRALSALPGLTLPGDPDGYPTKDEVGDYLESYARWLGVTVHLRTAVRRLSTSGGLFHADTERGDEITARAAVIAAGAFQEPIVPPHADQLTPAVVQLTAATYRNPEHLPRGRVLVAGDGATGRQIALELAGDREVLLATGRRRVVTAQRILGRDQLWWSDRLGLLRASRDSAVGRLVRKLDAFPGEQLRLGALRRRGVRVVRRLRSVRGTSAHFADGTSAEIAAIVWTMGYRERSAWVDIDDAKDAAGRLVERQGVSPVGRLYVVGRDWQWSRGSALLGGVARDAAFVADRIMEQLAAPRNTAVADASRPAHDRPPIGA